MVDLEKIELLHRKYAPDEKLFELVYTHCKIVRDIAMWCADNIQEPVDKALLEEACLLHDIGSYSFMHNAFDKRYYVQHATLGAKLLQGEGYSEKLTDIVESHVLLGLTKEEIVNSNWRLPFKNYTPTSIEGRLLCYADRFHTKKPIFNSYDFLYERFLKDFPGQASKLVAWSEEFGMPDLDKLSKKYKHPIQ